MGLGGKIGISQEIDGNLESSNGFQFRETGADMGGFGAKTIKKTDEFGNSSAKSEESFTIGGKFIIGVEFKF
jgi:hypothetical protein